jgi:hypothetical protein
MSGIRLREKRCAMIELKKDQLVFQFPDVHADAELRIDFQRTLRIPDDGREYPLPPGLGSFPLRHVDDFAESIPSSWISHGGVMLPMYQSEALWVNFSGRYPFAVKVATGKINAVTGEAWKEALNRDPQDYMSTSEQPWLDGYCVEKGVIRQFVAMPLGSGYSAEEQITGEAEYGGLQIVVYPLKGKVYERTRRWVTRSTLGSPLFSKCMRSAAPDMGLAPGGRMRQEIYDDLFDLDDWDLRHSGRCFVHIANSLVWNDITGQDPPTTPPTARSYSKAGLPWFDFYSDNGSAVDGSDILSKLKSVVGMGAEKGEIPLPENESVKTNNVVMLRKGLRKGQVREGRF